MAKRDQPERTGRETDPAEGTPGPAASSPENTAGGPLESLFQETIRRAVSLGLGGFFLTEGAVRKAVSDTIPREWVDFLNQQSEEVRGELQDRLVSEFRSWLHALDVRSLLREVLDEYEFSASIDLSAHARKGDAETPLQVIHRRK